jgi:hypothetical protein
MDERTEIAELAPVVQIRLTAPDLEGVRDCT